MDSIIVNGGTELSGSIKISGAKNAALPIMAASLLTPEEITINNVPSLIDIETMHQLLTNHGALSKWSNKEEVKIKAQNIDNKVAPYDIVRKMRASIWALGPLLARFGHAEVSMPGGCAIGARLVDQHVSAMEALGAEVKTENGYIKAKCRQRLQGANFHFSKVSVGATINALLASTLAEGESIFTNCACEPEIIDLANFLNKMGADISGIGTNRLIIKGKKELGGAKHSLIADRIEAGTYIAAVASAGGELIIENIDYKYLINAIEQFKKIGLDITKLESNLNHTNISSDKIKVKKTDIILAADMETKPYPGFPTDLQAQYMAAVLKANGTSIITENIFENRFMHVPELVRMGADVKIDGHTAVVKGVSNLSGAEVMASDLRASSSLIIAAMGSSGISKIRRIYHLDRGYEKIEEKLQNCGIDIKREHGDKI